MFAKLPERFPRKLSAGIRPTTNVFGHVGLQVKNRLVRVFQKRRAKKPFQYVFKDEGSSRFQRLQVCVERGSYVSYGLPASSAIGDDSSQSKSHVQHAHN